MLPQAFVQKLHPRYTAAAVSQYAASEEFAEIVNASSGAKRYIEEGILVPDEISDDTLGRIVSYFQEL